nr:phytolongin Phyl2.1 [Ipomoea trifida]
MGWICLLVAARKGNTFPRMHGNDEECYLRAIPSSEKPQDADVHSIERSYAERHLSFVHYACVAKDNVVLAKFNSEDAHLGALAMRCLEKTPEFHSMFTHTVRQRPVRTSIPNQP